MNNAQEIPLRKQIFDDCPDIEIVSKEDKRLVEAQSVNVDAEGKIISIMSDGNLVDVSEVIVHKNFLPVPGVGYLKPGTLVRYQDDMYVLDFGWHTNISNQRIYSWFLKPTKEKSLRNPKLPIFSEWGSSFKTLYYEMIDEIDLVTV